MARRKKKHHEEEHENMERWLVSYADFITLLFAFFVTMYSVSRVDGKKMGSAVESLQRALGSVIAVQMTQREPGVFPSETVPIEFSITPIEGKPYTAENKALGALAREILVQIEETFRNHKVKAQSEKAGQMKFFLDKRGLILRFSEPFFFGSGDASINPEMIPILEKVGQSLERIPNQIRIEGHTDNIPIQTAKYPSNWELSTARATAIVRYFIDRFDFQPHRLSATGYAEFRPIATNQTSEGRLQNRRVDLVILASQEMQTEPQTPPPGLKQSL
jgi:chemotaxis protein MotB